MKITMAAVVGGIALSVVGSNPALANSLIGAGPHSAIARSTISATVDGEWNKLSRTEGANIEVWTKDGDNLNKVSFYGGLPSGSSLYRERDPKNAPLPKVSNGMLLPDIPTLLETTYRAQYKVNRMTIGNQEAAMLDGKPAIRFEYSYIRTEDEVERKGEAVGAIDNGRLYLVTYEAPGIYFYDRDLPHFRQVVSTLKF